MAVLDTYSTSVARAHEWVDRLDVVADEFAEYVVRALRRAIRAGTSTLGVVTAAAVEPEPLPATTVVPPLVALDELVAIERAWREEVRDVVIPAVEKFMRMGADQALEDIARQAPVLLDMTQPSAELHLVGVRNRLVGVGQDLWEKTRDELVLGMQDGESIPQLSTRVRGVLNSTEARARVIARTEVIGASNAGSFIQMTMLPDPPTKKSWLATRDDRTRLSHLAANGQIVPLDDNFTVGNASLRFPGDPQGPADEVINCRCTLLYDFDDESMLTLNTRVHTFHLAGKHNQAEHGHGGKKLSPKDVDTNRLNAAETAELDQIAKDHAAGTLSDKDAKYKAYYVKVKASKRINKSDEAKGKIGGETSKDVTPSTKNASPTDNEISVGDQVDTPKGVGTVVATKGSLVDVKTSDGKQHYYGKSVVTKKSSGSVSKNDEASASISDGDKVVSKSGVEGTVLFKNASGTVFVKTDDGDEFAFNEDKLTKIGVTKSSTLTSPSTSVSSPTKITGGSKTTIKPSQLQSHHYNQDEINAIGELDLKLMSGELTEKQHKSKMSYLKYKVAKRVNEGSAPAGVGASTKLAPISVKSTPVSTSPGPVSINVPGSSSSSFSQTSLAVQMRKKNASVVQDRVIKKANDFKQRVGTHGGTTQERSALNGHRAYIGTGYTPINEGLRTGNLSLQAARHVKGMDDAFQLFGTVNENPMTVNRGVKGPYAQRLKKLTPGTVISDSGYTSTTTDGYTASSFKGSNGVGMRINVPAGKPVVAGTSYESEIVFQRGTSMKFTGIGADGIYEFDML